MILSRETRGASATRNGVDPAADRLTLTFNRAEWATDTRNQSISVVVYREGLPGTMLPANATSLTFSDFEADLGSTDAIFNVVVVNNSYSATNGVSVTAASSLAPQAN